MSLTSAILKIGQVHNLRTTIFPFAANQRGLRLHLLHKSMNVGTPRFPSYASDWNAVDAVSLFAYFNPVASYNFAALSAGSHISAMMPLTAFADASITINKVASQHK